jgi:hypothetical protein
VIVMKTEARHPVPDRGRHRSGSLAYVVSERERCPPVGIMVSEAD